MHVSGADGELVEFAFVSQVAADLPVAVFARVARQSWSFNTRMNLTGELRLQDHRFLQVIEGPCNVVQSLAARILADPRHGSIRITAFRPLARRRYSTWTVSGFDLTAPEGQATLHPAANLHFLPAEKGAAPLVASVRSLGAATV